MSCPKCEQYFKSQKPPEVVEVKMTPLGPVQISRYTGKCYSLQAPGGFYVWNVSIAEEIVANGHKAFELPSEAMYDCLKINMDEDFILEHVEHVDPTKPGIVGTIVTEKEIQLIFMEGTHRLFRCCRDGLPFYVKVMTPKETEACLMEYTPERQRNPMFPSVGEMMKQ